METLRGDEAALPQIEPSAVRQSSSPIPLWRDHILFYEYFHGDNGAGLGASHQTGWTGLVAIFIRLYGLDPKRFLEGGTRSLFKERVLDAQGGTALDSP
jgi:hypothetical protein